MVCLIQLRFNKLHTLIQEVITMDIEDVKEAIEKEIEDMSWWYRNCRSNRLHKADCCQECPFRVIIEVIEDES